MNEEIEKQKNIITKVKYKVIGLFSKPQAVTNNESIQTFEEYSVNIQEEDDSYLFKNEPIERDDFKLIAAKNLEQGWFWHQYDDGSGSLYSPDNEYYFSYDLTTYIGGVEYMETKQAGWDVITNIKFEDFKKYAENVVVNRYQRNDDHIIVQNEELNITDDIFTQEETANIKMPM